MLAGQIDDFERLLIFYRTPMYVVTSLLSKNLQCGNFVRGFAEKTNKNLCNL